MLQSFARHVRDDLDGYANDTKQFVVYRRNRHWRGGGVAVNMGAEFKFAVATYFAQPSRRGRRRRAGKLGTGTDRQEASWRQAWRLQLDI